MRSACCASGRAQRVIRPIQSVREGRVQTSSWEDGVWSSAPAEMLHRSHTPALSLGSELGIYDLEKHGFSTSVITPQEGQREMTASQSITASIPPQQTSVPTSQPSSLTSLHTHTRPPTPTSKQRSCFHLICCCFYRISLTNQHVTLRGMLCYSQSK